MSFKARHMFAAVAVASSSSCAGNVLHSMVSGLGSLRYVTPTQPRYLGFPDLGVGEYLYLLGCLRWGWDLSERTVTHEMLREMEDNWKIFASVPDCGRAQELGWRGGSRQKPGGFSYKVTFDLESYSRFSTFKNLIMHSKFFFEKVVQIALTSLPNHRFSPLCISEVKKPLGICIELLVFLVSANREGENEISVCKL